MQAKFHSLNVGFMIRCSVAALAISSASPVLAQTETNTTTAPVQDRLQEVQAAQANMAGANEGSIVVTARRSAEKLSNVPLSITALTSQELTRRGITDLQGVANATPGLRFTDFLDKFNGNAVIRGLSQTNVQNAVGNTGVFIDGIYLQRGYMIDSQLADLERIEVVKGPQSALYGQNTFSGAINYVLRQPTDELHINGQASAGNAGYTDVRLGVGGPIIKGLLDARVYYARSNYDGTWKNNFPGMDNTDLSHFGGYKRRNFSGSAKLTPMDGLIIRGTYYKLTRNEKIDPFYTIDGNVAEDKLNCGATAANGSPYLWCGNLPSNPSGKRSGLNTGNYPSGLFTVEQPGLMAKTEMYHISLEYKFTPSLTLNYDYGHVTGSAIEQSVFASNSYNPASQKTITEQREAGLLHYYSHDVRLAWDNGGPFKIDFGYFNSYTWDSFIFGLKYGLPTGVAVLNGSSDPLSTGGVTPFTNELTRYWTNSGYARASYKLLDNKVTLAAEARYTSTTLDEHDRQASGEPDLRANYHNLTPRFTIQYQPTSKFQVYASAAEGVKAGGFNGYVSGSVTLTKAEQSFGPEKNWTYELGAKGMALNNRLTYSADIFYIDWSKRQIATPPSNYVPASTEQGAGAVPSIYVSGGAAKSYGVELQGAYRLGRYLNLNASFSWQHATVGHSNVATVASTVCDNIVCNKNGDNSGNFLGNVPWLQASGGFEYRRPIKDDVQGFFGADEVFRGKLYTDETNTASIAPFALTNVRLGVEKKGITAFFWTKNLFDKKYVDASFVVPSILQYNVSLGERRTFGVTVSFNY